MFNYLLLPSDDGTKEIVVLNLWVVIIQWGKGGPLPMRFVYLACVSACARGGRGLWSAQGPEAVALGLSSSANPLSLPQLQQVRPTSSVATSLLKFY